MQCNKIFTRIADKRRKRKAAFKAYFKHHQQEQEHTESTSTGGDRRVRFSGRDSVKVFERAPQQCSSEMGKKHLWYNKKELNEQFLHDLESHLVEQIRRAQANSDSTEDPNNGRGLELHLQQNQRRREKAEAYVKHIVEKSCDIRKEGLRQRKLPTLGRHKTTRVGSSRHPAALQRFADEIGEYASQYTLMSRDLALGVAVEDEAQARAIYQEEQEEADSNNRGDDTSSDKENSSEFVPLACQASQRKTPRSYTAKSA